MKRAILFLLGFIVALTASGQSGFYEHYQLWRFYPGSFDTITFEGKGYQRVLYEPQADSSTFIYTLTKQKKVWPTTSISIQANSFAAQSGVFVTDGKIRGVNKESWLKYNMNIAVQHKSVRYRYAVAGAQSGGVEFRTGSITGPVFASMILPATGAWTNYVDIVIPITTPVNASEIYLTFKNSPRYEGCNNIESITFE